MSVKYTVQACKLAWGREVVPLFCLFSTFSNLDKIPLLAMDERATGSLTCVYYILNMQPGGYNINGWLQELGGWETVRNCTAWRKTLTKRMQFWRIRTASAEKRYWLENARLFANMSGFSGHMPTKYLSNFCIFLLFITLFCFLNFYVYWNIQNICFSLQNPNKNFLSRCLKFL